VRRSAKEPTEAPYQSEAKEFLRSRLIGKKVLIVLWCSLMLPPTN